MLNFTGVKLVSHIKGPQAVGVYESAADEDNIKIYCKEIGAGRCGLGSWMRIGPVERSWLHEFNVSRRICLAECTNPFSKNVVLMQSAAQLLMEFRSERHEREGSSAEVGLTRRKSKNKIVSEGTHCLYVNTRPLLVLCLAIFYFNISLVPHTKACKKNRF